MRWSDRLWFPTRRIIGLKFAGQLVHTQAMEPRELLCKPLKILSLRGLSSSLNGIAAAIVQNVPSALLCSKSSMLRERASVPEPALRCFAGLDVRGNQPVALCHNAPPSESPSPSVLAEFRNKGADATDMGQVEDD